jgi:hypothetical protein
MTDDELRALPPVFGLAEAAEPLDLSRSAVYALARTGDLPVPVIRIGARMKVRRCDLLKFLGVAENAAPTPVGPSAA